MMSQRARNGLDSRHGFALGNQHPGAAGTTIGRVVHTYKGVREFHAASVVVTGARGNVISESASDRRNGLDKGDFNVAPGLSAKAAIDGVIARVSPNGKPIDPPSAELVIYPIVSERRTACVANKAEKDLNATDLQEVVTGYQLAYLGKTRMTTGNTPQFYDTLVSATDGSAIDRWSRVQTVVGTGNSQYNGAVPINTTLNGSTDTILDATRGTGGLFGGMAITNANYTTSAGTIYTNATNIWGGGLNYTAGGSTTNADGLSAPVNAAWGLQNTYDMLNNTLGWKSWTAKTPRPASRPTSTPATTTPTTATPARACTSAMAAPRSPAWARST